MNSQILWLLSGLTFIVILSAGFNYTNLSIARSLRRAKEVGVRKVVGASRNQIFSQFMVEAVLISLISLIFATLLFYFIKPGFLNLDEEVQETVNLLTTPTLFIYFIIFTVFVGMMAGLFPAVFLSKLKAVTVLKASGSTRVFGKLNMRKILIVVQFTLSLIFIISATIAYKQYKYSLAFDLGFKTENVLNIRTQGNDANIVASAFASIPEVTGISKAQLVPSTGNLWADRIKFEDPMDSSTLYYNTVDENYIPMFEHVLIAGSNFESRPEQEQEESIILNEYTLKRFNIGTPEEAIGKSIQLGRDAGNRLQIIGVVKDFYYGTIGSPVECFGFRYDPDSYQYLNLKISSTDLISTMKKIEGEWKKIDNVHEFQGTFYDERIERAYAEYSVIFTIVGFLAFITVSIAALGLLGMAVYTAETRLKEISIRKVLGATESNLIKLLAKGFMWLLVIAALIAMPITYFLFDTVVLAESVNRINIGIVELFSGVILIFSIGLLTIGSQTYKAAKSNPADTLRSE
jgi:putative ABC transport system permease protein